MEGFFLVEIKRKTGETEKLVFPNVVTREGKNHLLKVGVSGEDSVNTWYMGLIGANITPSETDTASTALGSGGSYSEVTSYSPTGRPQYYSQYSNNAVSNANQPCAFVATADITVYGVFLVSNSTKGSSSGILLSAGVFSSAKSLSADDTLTVTYTISSVV